MPTVDSQSPQSFAPWTAEEVDSLNEFQKCPLFHPFTCAHRGSHIEGADDVLIAGYFGWKCPSCDYAQNWAHRWMVSGAWRLRQAIADEFIGKFAKEVQDAE